MGHGHVTPNPDGSVARCGGPAMCSVCALEKAQLEHTGAIDVPAAAHNARPSQTVNIRHEPKQFIRIGQYTISPFAGGGFWIGHEGGEGMQVKADSLEALFTQFWADYF